METFQTILKENYGTPAQNLDFALDASRIGINKWVEEFTNQRIKELIPEGVFLDKRLNLIAYNRNIHF